MRVEVLTFKEGLLSRVPHDLKLSCEVTVDGWSAQVDPRSLRVVCAMKKGREDHGTLSESDKRKIQKSLREDVLHVARFPTIRFTPTQVSEDRVEGVLDLHGVQKPVVLAFRGGVARVRLHQPDFGIRPYSAMMGALKVKAGVEVLVHEA